jgi:hypothetical protein
MRPSRRAVDGDAAIHQALANFVNIVDAEGQMAKVATVVIGLDVVVIGQFDLGIGRRVGGNENQHVAVFRAIAPAAFLEAQKVAVKFQRCIDIGNADHGVKVSHVGLLIGDQTIP